MSSQRRGAHDTAYLNTSFISPKPEFVEPREEVDSLEVQVRLKTGKYAAWKQRKEWLVPGVILGRDEKGVGGDMYVSANQLEIDKLLRKYRNAFENVPLDLKFKGHDKVVRCFPWQCTFDAWGNMVKCNFKRLRTGTSLKVPIALVGEEDNVAIKRGAFMMQMLSRVEVTLNTINPSEIPRVLQVDITDTRPGDVIRPEILNVPDAITLDPKYIKHSVAIAVCKGKASLVEEDEEGEEEDG